MRPFTSFALVLAVLAGCSNSSSQPVQRLAPAVQTVEKPAPPPVSRIVFIDKEEACPCNQKAIDASWTALQVALKGATLPVERIHADTQEALAAGYKDKRPMMAVPGLYFLAENGSIVELLQGEVTADQIRAALGL